MLRKNPCFFEDAESRQSYAKTGELLLENAAKNGSPQAAIAIAKNAEWRLKDIKKALEYTSLALAAQDLPEGLREDLEKRRARLDGKLR